MHGLAPLVAGDADHRALRHGRVAGEGGLDLGGIDVLATGNDHVLDPVADVDETLLVHVAAVAGVHPAAPQRLGGGFRLVPVAHHHVRSAHHDLADGAARHLVVLGIDDAHFHADRRQAGRVHPAAGLAFGAVMLRQQRGGQRRQFGHAVALGEAGGGEHAAGAVEQRRGDRRGAIADALQRTEVELLQFRVGVARIQQHLDHGRRQQDLADAFAGDGLQYLLRHEGRLHHVRPPGHEQCGHGREVGQVEHRHHVQIAGVGLAARRVHHSQG
ncbi:hypothetical protein D9M70_356770 [compost metagenome]